VVGIHGHTSVSVKGAVVYDVLISPVSRTFRLVEHEVGGIVRNISDSGEVPYTDVQPDGTAVYLAARVVEGEGVVPVAVGSAA
jgi:hypothetical protein